MTDLRQIFNDAFEAEYGRWGIGHMINADGATYFIADLHGQPGPSGYKGVHAACKTWQLERATRAGFAALREAYRDADKTGLWQFGKDAEGPDLGEFLSTMAGDQ